MDKMFDSAAVLLSSDNQVLIEWICRRLIFRRPIISGAPENSYVFIEKRKYLFPGRAIKFLHDESTNPV